MLSRRASPCAALLVLALAALLGPVAADATPRRGGEMVFAQEAQVSGLDMHFSSAISSRNIAMHVYECLLTRDEANAPPSPPCSSLCPRHAGRKDSGQPC